MEERYLNWTSRTLEDPDLTAEMEAIKGNEEEINDRFYRDLTFGTGGLRGVIGAGTNRMNIYTVRKATQGIADYINQNFTEGSIAVSYDSRHKSDVFAKEVARVCAANGIKAYVYPELMPTPALSFAVRHLKCSMGVMVTASHNPAKYNGYKAYGCDGCQITNEIADAVLANILAVDAFDDVKTIPFDEGLKNGMISYIGSDVVESYYQNVLKQSIHSDIVKTSGFKVVYTPLNGTGNKPVREILKRIGITDVTVVKEQEMPDGDFTTCPYPNPEIKETLQLGMEYCEKTGCDLLLATDPDADRVGIAVKWNGDYKLLTGNEVGALLLNYIASQRTAMGTMPEKPLAVKTIVTTDLCKCIAEKYGVELVNVLTGFKYIGEYIGNMEEKGEEDNFIFGYEESYGYLSGTYVRDKDAVVASMLICEMAAFYAKEGRNLVDVLNELYKTYGYHLCTQQSFVFEGEEGMEKMQNIMNTLRENPARQIGTDRVLGFGDYLKSLYTDMTTGKQSKIDLPDSNVLLFELDHSCKAIIRPSGTEPKIKIYYFVIRDDEISARKKEDELRQNFMKLLKI